MKNNEIKQNNEKTNQIKTALYDEIKKELEIIK